MNKLTLSVLAAALSLATGCNVLDGVFGSKFALVDGERTATIVLPENAEDSTTYAADLLVKYVGKITGRKLEVRSSALQPSTFNLQPSTFHCHRYAEDAGGGRSEGCRRETPGVGDV